MRKSDKIENTYIAILAAMIAIVAAIIVLNTFFNFRNVESNITVERLATQNLNNIESASSNVGNTVLQNENNIDEGNENKNIENEVPTSTDNTQPEQGLTNNGEPTDILNSEEQTNETNAQSEESQEEIENTEENLENENTVNTSSDVQSEETKPITFVKPVEGEIIKEFAKDNLVYSETLLEWTTHLGIDIKAEKTTVVKSAADGTVKSIKNDPRYGLTVVIEHSEGYQTIYSNLLSTEFVVEGENVSQGQSIGTVGNTAIFEISDETHLHFELLQNGEYLNPEIFIK